ncbi:unnamed protein product [Mycena citricolor]|uniref:Catalase core domain-containing protein n=1 Tax=Mycena citricolor TaxID=2018698 RepID=A0AAD2Q7G0_9AGAR|nr:unnamed protein product [Mycena citricolor]
MFELHPGFRPSHARGVMLTGSFTPTPDAAALSAAPHFHQASTPVTARFSSSTGLPLIPDNDPNANPRGVALRFNLAEHKHTDIIGISTPTFPAHDGRGFLEFMRASAEGSVADFLVSHPAAKTFVETPKPFSTSFANEAYYALHAFKFTSRTGETRYGRYSIVPSAGAQYLDQVTAKAKGESYLFDELQARIARGPISFEILLQVAQDGDNVDDTTVAWPADRQKIVLGIFSLDTLVPDNAVAQKQIIFDPIPRIQGIDESDDPLFEFRAALYLISGAVAGQHSMYSAS